MEISLSIQKRYLMNRISLKTSDDDIRISIMYHEKKMLEENSSARVSTLIKILGNLTI